MKFKNWLLLKENIKKTPLLNQLHAYLTTQQISDKQFMIEFLNWFYHNKNDLREFEHNGKITSEIEMYLNDELTFNLQKDLLHVKKIKEFLNKPENKYYLDDLKHYVLHNYINHEDSPYKTPAHRYYSFIKVIGSNNWLLHFTNSPDSVKKNGFQIGVENFDDLPLTKIHGHSKSKPGYNFAFLAKDFKYLNPSMTYLSDDNFSNYSQGGLLMFKGSGVLVYHIADNKEEVIFDGSSINPKSIVVIKPDDSLKKWTVKSQNPEFPDPFSGNMQEAIQWVKNNFKKYESIL